MGFFDDEDLRLLLVWIVVVVLGLVGVILLIVIVLLLLVWIVLLRLALVVVLGVLLLSMMPRKDLCEFALYRYIYICLEDKVDSSLCN